MKIPRKNWAIFFKENAYTTTTSFMLLVLLIFLSSLVSFSILLGVSALVGENFNGISEQLSKNNSLALRNFIRFTILIQHLFLFIIPALSFSIILYHKYWLSFLKVNRIPSIFNIFFGSLLIIIAFPLAQLSYQLNKQIPLPVWAQTIEDKALDLINNLLLVESSYEFYFNLFVIAIIPALGEELLFRGIIQQKLRESLQNPTWAIILAAFFFSAFHMQFEGFLPRFLLGALLGFIFYWTNNLWIPIFTHFVYNASQIIAHRLYQAEFSNMDLDNIGNISWGTSFISFSLLMLISYFFISFNKNQLKT